MFILARSRSLRLSPRLPHPPPLPKLPRPYGTPPLALFADLALKLFLAMSLMSLQLWTRLDAAGPLLVILDAQTAVCWFLMPSAAHRVLGGGYDAAASPSGYFSLALGATPTAIAIMTAIEGARREPEVVRGRATRRWFFVDLANAVMIQTFLGWLGR